MIQEDGLRKHAFWFYGVIVGLAIKESLTTVVPHIFDSSNMQPGELRLEASRLFVFLIMIIRYYLGSVVFYEKAYSSPVAFEPTATVNDVVLYKKVSSANKHDLKKSYAIDFLFGFVHFLVFFAWALSIEAHRPARLFPGLLSFILLYDLAWFIVSMRYDTQRLIKLWTWINVVTFTLGLLCYWGARAWEYPPMVAQQVAFIPVVIVSAIDIFEITMERKVFAKWLGKLIDLEPKN